MLDAPKEMIDNMISLYEEGNIISILNNSDELITKYPNNATIHNLLGAGFSQFNEVEKKSLPFEKSYTVRAKKLPNFKQFRKCFY